MLLINENIKQYYRFIEFVSKLVGIDLPHERFKLIALNKYKAESKEEREVSSLKDAYLYLLNNSSQVLTRQLLINTYYLLTNKFLNSEIVDRLIEEYYKRIDDPVMQLTSYMHYLVLTVVNERKIEFAFIVSNFILEKFNEKLLVPLEYKSEKYCKSLKNMNKEELLLSLYDMQVSSAEKENKVFQYPLEEVIRKIKEKDKILKNRFLVENLYLYGSIAKDTNYSSSDVDLLVIFNKQLTNYEKEKMKNVLYLYLKNEVNINADIIDFTNALEKLDICEMEKVIKVI